MFDPDFSQVFVCTSLSLQLSRKIFYREKIEDFSKNSEAEIYHTFNINLIKINLNKDSLYSFICIFFIESGIIFY